MFGCIWNCMSSRMGAMWMWWVFVALVAAIIAGVSTGNPYIGAAVGCAILFGLALVTFLNCWFACTRGR